MKHLASSPWRSSIHLLLLPYVYTLLHCCLLLAVCTYTSKIKFCLAPSQTPAPQREGARMLVRLVCTWLGLTLPETIRAGGAHIIDNARRTLEHAHVGAERRDALIRSAELLLQLEEIDR